MADDIIRDPPADNRLALQPARTYMIPGGPTRQALSPINVARLAEIIRGGEGDSGYGDRR